MATAVKGQVAASSVGELESRIEQLGRLADKARIDRSEADKAAREYMKEIEKLRGELIVALKAR
jgi:hypothetical protein